MMKRSIMAIKRLKRLCRDEDGVAIPEFVLIMPVLMMLLMGAIDVGYQFYVRSVTQGVVEKAARRATVGGISQSVLDSYIQDQLAVIKTQKGTVTIVKKSYSDFSSVGSPEKITTDTAPLGIYNAPAGLVPGDCYEDANGNGQYDTDKGAAGMGGADDVIFYEVTVTIPRLFPIERRQMRLGGKVMYFGWGADQVTTAKAIVRNQPYATQTINKTVRCT
jgi:TadE-like protein